MGFFSNVAQRVRNYWARDKEQVARQLAKGATGGSFPDSGYDLLQAYGYDVVADFLRLEADLISRYIDYEEMDTYGVLSSALDIYADDSTPVDTSTGKTIWATSRDQNVQTAIDDLFNRRLRLDEEIWSIARTMCHYGSDFEETLVTQDGVVGLNHLPPPTVRRIEGPRGELYGFVQDYQGRFAYSPAEFQQILAQRTSNIRGIPLDDPTGQRQLQAAMEDWEVAHFRLQLRTRRSIYGMCLVGSSRVWTPSGIKEIRDVVAGDKVFTRHAGMLRTTVVLDQVCNGTKPVFRLRTPHREIVLTANHPVLVDRGGKNNVWVPVERLKLGERIVAAAHMPEMHSPPPLGLLLRERDDQSTVRISLEGSEALRTVSRGVRYSPRDSGLRSVAAGVGISRGVLDELLEGRSTVALSVARSLFRAVGLPFFEGAVTFCDSDPRLKLPNFVEPWFARLFGYMLGNGWVTDGQVCFARGMHEERNKRYESYFERMGLPVSRTERDGRETQSYVSSQALVWVFHRLGWVGGAHEKRVPPWVYCLGEEFRKEFLAGFMDADGWVTYKGRYQNTELCNRELLRDLKNLVDGMGWTSGQVRHRRPRPGTAVNGRIVQGGPDGSFLLTYRCDPLASGEDFSSEEVLSIEPAGEELVYDICVADTEHCFVADGLVVHNSVLDSARWIWKRLILLEDSALIYRLQRSPERYAFYVDVGNLPPAEALAYLNKVRRQYKRRQFVDQSGNLSTKFSPLSPDQDIFLATRRGEDGTKVETLSGPSWQSVDDLQYFLDHMFTAIKIPKAYLAQDENINRATLCLVGDTRIPLLDGRTRTMRELVEEYGPDGHFHVYSCDDQDRVVVGEASGCRVTRKAAEVWEVVLDDGTRIRGTADHPFLLRDGTYRNLSSLASGDSLMPLYRKVSSGRTRAERLEGYEMVQHPSTGGWEYTHSVVCRELRGDGHARSGLVCHHRSFNKRNNDPGELELLIQRVLREAGTTYREFAEQYIDGQARRSLLKRGRNHRVVSVQRVGIEDCYDFTVARHHNFAVSTDEGGGVFVHNSAEDVRFARTIMRVQRELKNGASKIGRVHLAALNLDPDQHVFETHMTTPSAIFELAQLEARSSRADLASKMGEFMSLYWVYSHVLGLGDSEIEEVLKQREDEAIRNAVTQAKAEMEAQKLQQPEESRGRRGRLAGRGGKKVAAVVSRPVGPLFGKSAEEDLFRGRNLEAEKKATDQLDQLLKKDERLRRRIDELRGLVRDLISASRR